MLIIWIYPFFLVTLHAIFFSRQMKQLYTVLVLFSLVALNVCANPVYAAAADESDVPVVVQTGDVQADSVVTVTKKYDVRDHWTIGLKGGINYFDLLNTLNSPKSGNNGDAYGVFSDMSQQFAVFSEYSFEYGLGVGAYLGHYSFNRYSTLGGSLEFGLYMHMSLLETLSWGKPLPIARRFHIFWDVGLGVSALWQFPQVPGAQMSDTTSWRPVAVLRTALQFEFMVRPHWGLLAEFEYHGYGRPLYKDDAVFYASPWINAFMLNVGVRYYFDNRQKEKDPLLDENDMPIRKPKVHETKVAKNAVYVNVNITPEMIAQALKNGGSYLVQAVGQGQAQSEEIENALQVLEEQGEGTVLINSIRFEEADQFAESSEEQLTEEAMQLLDKVAGSLLNNQLWTKVNLLYMSDKRALARAAVIATYLRAKGVKNLSVKGYDTHSNDATSDLVITIK